MAGCRGHPGARATITAASTTCRNELEARPAVPVGVAHARVLRSRYESAVAGIMETA
ncbi:hypothetical protein GH890_30305 [Bacillus thuringiensis]|nr:hypothetical protein [Bacillus thuringiensis]